MLLANKTEAEILVVYPRKEQPGMGRRQKKHNRQQRSRAKEAAKSSESAVQATAQEKTCRRQVVSQGQSATSGAKEKAVKPQQQLTAEEQVKPPAEERVQEPRSPPEVRTEPEKLQQPPQSTSQASTPVEKPQQLQQSGWQTWEVNVPVEKFQQPPQAATQFVRGGYHDSEPRDWCQVCGERFPAPSDWHSLCEVCATNHPELVTLSRFQIYQYFLERGLLTYYRRGIGVFEMATNF